MTYWDWEFFESEVTSDFFNVADHGPLFGPVTDFTITRDEGLNLVLETTSEENSISNTTERPAGTVYIATEEVILKDRVGSLAIATGVIPRGYRRMHANHSTLGTTKETSSIQSLQWTRAKASEPSHIIEWVENMSEAFIWPDSDDLTEAGEKSRKLRSPECEITLSIPIDSMEASRSCVHLVIGDVELFVGKSRTKVEHIEKPGFILYLGTPDESTRSKIRNCLSFCLGNFLIYLGDTTYDSKWSPISFNARSGHALVESASKLSGWQPAPLSLRWEYEITPELLSRMMSSLYKIYDIYSLESIFWSYWHALAAPVHMAAAHYGSAIEALQLAYLKVSADSIHKKIVEDDKTWKELREKISLCIADANLSETATKMLVSKVQNLNFAPQSVIMERFCVAIGLEIGTLETAVWKNRNRAAHGGGAKANNASELIKGNKVLLIMMNRILLALGGGSDFFYDYYSLRRPTIHLSHPIQEQ